MNQTFGDEPPSSSTFDDSSSPPRPSRDSPLRHAPTNPQNGVNRPQSLRAMGNVPSAANTSDLRSQQPSHARHTQPTAERRRRVPAADHREDWLDHTATDRPSSFGYLTGGLFDTLEHDSPQTSDTGFTSDGIDIDEILTNVHTDSEVEEMPTTRRRGQQDGESIVDLTADSSPPAQNPESANRRRGRKRSADPPSQGRAPKRSRRSENAEEKIEELDLTNEAPSAEEELLQTQQQQLLAAQQQASSEDSAKGPLRIGKRQCIICMENFTNATIAHCGHIYCHECLTQALVAGEKNSERGVGNCPVCRKPVNRKRPNQMIPVSFMKKGTFKGKARRDVASLA